MRAAWILASLIALALSTSYLLDGPDDITAAQAVEADRQDAEAMASRQFVAQKVCGNGTATWFDDKTLVCGKRQPLRLAKAKL